MMIHDERVMEVLVYRRNVGADLPSIRAHVKNRGNKKYSAKNDRAALSRLEKAGKIVQVGEKWFLTPQEIGRARGAAISPEWLVEDSTILFAILFNSKEGCELHDILGAVDYVDRSFPTLEQLHGALNRLAAAGLVKTRRGLYLATEKAIGIHAKVKAACRRSPRSQVRGLRRILECPCCGVELKKVRWHIAIDDAALQEALELYRERFRRA